MGKKIPDGFGDDDVSEAPWDMMHNVSDHLSYLKAEEDLRVRTCALDMAVTAISDVSSALDPEDTKIRAIMKMATQFEIYLRTGQAQ